MKEIIRVLRVLIHFYNQKVIEVHNKKVFNEPEIIRVLLYDIPSMSLSDIQKMVSGWNYFFIDEENNEIVLFKH